MCFNTPELPDPPPPPPPPPAQGARRVFEPVAGEAEDELAETLGLEQLRIRPPSLGV